MSMTTEINEAKDDLDHILGEVRRLINLMGPAYPLMEADGRRYAAENIANSIDIIHAKARKVRASL
ncbi:hypothetical protein SEA_CHARGERPOWER_89 [Mycobacterium phage Chargerpower]|nr:hypothetical protein SEA_CHARGERPOWER_89 [Mycobacterium phage Chargerpower]